MAKYKRLLAALVIIIVLSGTVLLQGTHAQDESGRLQLTTSPLPISLRAKPGTSVSTELRVRNSGLETETLKVDLMKFSAYGEEGKPQLEERGPSDDYFDWVTFSETQFVAEPNTWHDITMTITLPDDAAFGYYYAATFSRANPNVPVSGQEAAVEGGTATLVLLEAEVPNAQREMKLADFRVERKTYEFLPARFTVRLTNTGNIHGAPHGTIFISRGGKQLATLGVNDTSGNILPDSSRNFTAEWNDGFPVYAAKEANGAMVLKDGKPTYSLNWDLKEITKLRFGKYTAQLVMVYDDGEKDVPLEASVSFWVIPWRIIIVTLFISVFVLIGVWSSARKIIRRLRRQKKS